MLNTITHQQPELFENIAERWNSVTDGELFIFTPAGTRLFPPHGAFPWSWSTIAPYLNSHSVTNLPEIAGDLLAAPIVQGGQLVGYLLAVGAQQGQLPLLAWAAETILARIVENQAMQAMTDELISAWEQLELIYRVTENLSLTTDMAGALRAILQEMQKVTNCAEGFVIVHQVEDLTLCVTTSGQNEDILCSRVLLDNLVKTNHAVLCNKRAATEQIWPLAPDFIETLLAAPLEIADQAVPAAIGLLNKSNRNFTAADSKLLVALARHVATIIQNHITHRQQIVEERISRELEIAAEIQSSLLPTKLPQLGGLSMAVSSNPASEVGGDFYDFVTFNDRYLTVIIGDVSGKGIPAAMLTSVTRTMLRVEAIRGEPPHKIIQQANQILHQDLSRSDSFVTVFVATIDTQEGMLTYASAGHTPPLLWRYETHTVEKLMATSPPVGILDIHQNEARPMALKPGDTLVFYTDGVTETQSPDKALFGLDRLVELVHLHGSEAPEQIQRSIQAAIDKFRHRAVWRDDATLLTIKTLAQTESATNQPSSAVIKTIDFVYPAEMDYLTDISHSIAGTCRQLSGLPSGSQGDDFIYLIELAISEICTNIVKHAYAQNTGKIRGQVALMSNGVQLDFYDHGLGFDPTTVPEPKPDPNNLKEGGYGLHIVRQIMDVVAYESNPENGNHWHLVKFLPK